MHRNLFLEIRTKASVIPKTEPLGTRAAQNIGNHLMRRSGSAHDYEPAGDGERKACKVGVLEDRRGRGRGLELS